MDKLTEQFEECLSASEAAAHSLNPNHICDWPEEDETQA